MNATTASALSALSALSSSVTGNETFSNSTSIDHRLSYQHASPELSWLHVDIGLGFILLNVGVSSLLRLGIGSALLIAAFRCIGQLAIVAQLFRVVFESHNPWFVAGLTLLLNLLGTFEAVINKSSRRCKHMFPIVFLAMFFSSVPISILGAQFAMKVRPFWQPSEYIPILGMLCGATISGVVVATSSIMKEFAEHRDRVELLLAFGASRSEACTHIIRQALKLSLTPVINQMSVIGMIAIPGMMTGAILGGSPIAQAAKLQMIIMFMISAATVLASVIVSLCVVRVIVDGEVRIRSERVWNSGKGLAIVSKIGEKVKGYAVAAWNSVSVCFARMKKSARKGEGEYSEVDQEEEGEEEKKLLP